MPDVFVTYLLITLNEFQVIIYKYLLNLHNFLFAALPYSTQAVIPFRQDCLYMRRKSSLSTIW